MLRWTFITSLHYLVWYSFANLFLKPHLYLPSFQINLLCTIAYQNIIQLCLYMQHCTFPQKPKLQKRGQLYQTLPKNIFMENQTFDVNILCTL